MCICELLLEWSLSIGKPRRHFLKTFSLIEVRSRSLGKTQVKTKNILERGLADFYKMFASIVDRLELFWLKSSTKDNIWRSE